MLNEIKKIIDTALTELKIINGLSYSVELPPATITADVSTNIALLLSKILKKNPSQLAAPIIEKLKKEKIIADAKFQSGFINIILSDDFLFEQLKRAIIQADNFGKTGFLKNKKILVEFVSANPTGPLTVGHGRGTVIGDSISRILESLGCKVTREYYFNDAGLQMGILANSVYLRYRQLIGENVSFLEDHYQGEYIKEIAQKCRLEKGDNLTEKDLDYFKNVAIEYCFAGIKKDLKNMGVVFDSYFNESSLYQTGDIKKTISDLNSTGYTYEKEGALWFKSTEFGASKDKVLLRSTTDKEPTYRVTDIAYHRKKYERDYDILIDLFGCDHQDTYPDVIAALKVLGYDTSKIVVKIYQFVTLTSSGKQVKMSTRKANYITLSQLIDEIGVDAVRFFYLMRHMEAHLDFDLDLAKKQAPENPVYYVQYAHARICSIFREAEKANSKFQIPNSKLENLKLQEERQLIKQILYFEDIIELAARNYAPHYLTKYLQTLASLFHFYYNKVRIITANAQLTSARLQLCQAVKTVLKNGLYILGVSAPERM
ncbi:MAG: arginine--tRNA ligase [Elusimicrobiota bacterium]